MHYTMVVGFSTMFWFRAIKGFEFKFIKITMMLVKIMEVFIANHLMKIETRNLNEHNRICQHKHMYHVIDYCNTLSKKSFFYKYNKRITVFINQLIFCIFYDSKKTILSTSTNWNFSYLLSLWL